MNNIEEYCKRASIPEYREDLSWDDLSDDDKHNINAVRVIQFMADKGILEIKYGYQEFIGLVSKFKKLVSANWTGRGKEDANDQPS